METKRSARIACLQTSHVWKYIIAAAGSSDEGVASDLLQKALEGWRSCEIHNRHGIWR